MAKKKSVLLILLFTWVIFCLVWFFVIYKKDEKKTLAAIKPNVIQSQTSATEVINGNTDSDAAPKDSTANITATPTAATGSGTLLASSSIPVAAEKAMEEVVAVDTTVVTQALPVTTEATTNSIKKIEGGVNKKLSVCYFYNNSDKKLRNFSPRISKKIQAYLTTANTKIVITGHTDYIGSVEYNYKLGLQRAERVKQILIKKGIAAADIEVTSMGEEKPVANNKSLKGRARNRRVEINITLS